MLVPRFSLRWLLLLMTGFSVFFLVVRFAARGHHWAVGLVVAACTMVLSVLVYGLFFSVAYLLAGLLRIVRPVAPPASPFATDSLPPQVVPPRDAD